MKIIILMLIIIAVAGAYTAYADAKMLSTFK